MTDDGNDTLNTVTIRALREHPRKPGRYQLEFAPHEHSLPVIRPETPPSSVIRPMAVSVELIADLNLKPGRTLTPAEWQRLEAGAALVACYDKALATLGARARSTAELRRYLKTKAFTDEQIAPTIEKLLALGLLDDLAYARTYARSRSAPSRGLGPRRIAADLARKGIPRPIADQALRELADERQQHEAEAAESGATLPSAAEAAAAKKLKSLAALDPATRKRRLFGYLARRGFSNAEILAVLRNAAGTDDG